MKCNAHVCIYKYVEPFIPHFEFHFSNTSTIKPTNKKMRKEKIFFVALATVALASCTNDDYVGMDQAVEKAPMQILFNGGSNRTTRADATGATAAAMLNNQFRVLIGRAHV